MDDEVIKDEPENEGLDEESVENESKKKKELLDDENIESAEDLAEEELDEEEPYDDIDNT